MHTFKFPSLEGTSITSSGECQFCESSESSEFKVFILSHSIQSELHNVPTFKDSTTLYSHILIQSSSGTKCAGADGFRKPLQAVKLEASTLHFVMYKDIIYCEAAFDRAMSTSKLGTDLNDAKCRVKASQACFYHYLQSHACTGAAFKVIDTFNCFNRSIQETPISSEVLPQCPRCTGEMSLVDALVVCA